MVRQVPHAPLAADNLYLPKIHQNAEVHNKKTIPMKFFMAQRKNSNPSKDNTKQRGKQIAQLVD